MRDDSEQFIRDANVWVRDQLRRFQAEGRFDRYGNCSCSDAMCGSPSCSTCFPQRRGKRPYNDDVEPPLFQR